MLTLNRLRFPKRRTPWLTAWCLFFYTLLILRALFYGGSLAVMLLLIDSVARAILTRKGFAAFFKKAEGFMKNP